MYAMEVNAGGIQGSEVTGGLSTWRTREINEICKLAIRISPVSNLRGRIECMTGLSRAKIHDSALKVTNR